MSKQRPSVVLICHERDSIDRHGLAAWLASSMDLVGLVVIRDERRRLWTALARERRRSGWFGLADVLLFKVYYVIALARRDGAWQRQALESLVQRYGSVGGVPQIVVSNPNHDAVTEWLRERAPDLVIARCKYILRPEIFRRAGVGTFVLHPGICPEYRNAHGCFWALSSRDLGRVGVTLLKVDAGIDTGPVFLHASYPFDERRDSHVVIQYRVVLDNLDRIADALRAICRGEVEPLSTAGRRSAVWGHPRLSSYLRWKWRARRSSNEHHQPAFP